MRTIKFVSAFVLFALLLSVGGAVSSQAAQASLDIEQVRWLTYADPRFDFSMEYPSNWHVTPRDDSKGFGGTVSFESPGNLVRVEVGLYTAERSADVSLKVWTDKYNAISTPFKPGQVNVHSERLATVDGQAALRREGISPLTQFKYINISRGTTVWFIWTNSNDVHAPIYDRMVSSLRFGPNSPRMLREAYGPEFHPLLLDNETQLAQEISKQPLGVLTSDPAGYRLPFIGYKVISTGPGCSSWHQGQSSEAIDYVMNIGTAVLASYSGWISFYGYDNSGFGNLVKIWHQNGWESWYAHLSGFGQPMWVGRGWSGGCVVAYSGNSGAASTGPHLHFEVRLNGQSQWIRTLPTTSWYSGNPNNPCQPAGQDDDNATGPASQCYP